MGRDPACKICTIPEDPIPELMEEETDGEQSNSGSLGKGP